MAIVLRAVAAAVVVLVLGAAPAAADPAGPSDFRSVVTEVIPDASIDARILGGDSFLELTVAEGHTVIVEGYQGEPYLRFQPDGTVERNRLSEATYLNDDRRGRAEIPPDVREAGPDAAPEWERVGDGGTYAWHDHRVHWMAESSPPVDRGERVTGAYDPWRVRLVVDGAPGEVQGILVYEEAVSPVPYVGFAVIVGGLLAFYGRRPGLRLSAGLLAVVSAAALAVGWSDYSATPAGAGDPLAWSLAAVALGTAALATVLAGRGVGLVMALASIAALSGWALLRWEVLLKPVLPGDLPEAVDRTTVALALAVSAGAAVVALLTSDLRLPNLPDDE